MLSVHFCVFGYWFISQMLEKLSFRFLYNCFHFDLKLTTLKTKQTHFWLREEVFQINIGIAAKYTGLK